MHTINNSNQAEQQNRWNKNCCGEMEWIVIAFFLIWMVKEGISRGEPERSKGKMYSTN